MAETSTIPVLYEATNDGSRLRDYQAEIEAWLPSQPQGTRLMFLKNMPGTGWRSWCSA
jgi:hypothetical protein